MDDRVFAHLLDDRCLPSPRGHPGSTDRSAAGAFTVTVAHPVPRVTVVDPVGELDVRTSPDLDFHLDHELRHPERAPLILNLSHVGTGLAGVAVLTDPSIVMAMLPLVFAAVMVTVARHSVDWRTDGSDRAGPGPGAASAAVVAAAKILGAALAVAGLVEITGSAASPILQALALGATAVWWIRSPVAAEGWSPGRGRTGRLPAPATRSTAQLCRYWRSSFQRLHEPIDPSEFARILTARRDLLAELEHRDPAGFEQFLASPDAAGADPRRYFHSPHTHPGPIP